MEVIVKLQFVTPCLGRIRDGEKDRMHRAGDQVIFLPSWWKALFKTAAQGLGKHQKLAGKIQAALEIDGVPRWYKRYWAPKKYTKHEAFLEGDVIGVKFQLPPGMNLKVFDLF